MKNLAIKSLLVSVFVLFASQSSAKEDSSIEPIEQVTPWCNPFPKCAHSDAATTTDDSNAKSELILLWEKLTKEMKEAVERLPMPNQPE